MDRQKRDPKLTHHKPTGQWYVRVNGACHYLGTDRETAEQERLRILLEWRTSGGVFARTPPPPEITIMEVFARFAPWAREYYGGNLSTRTHGPHRRATDGIGKGRGRPCGYWVNRQNWMLG